ncbi:MAG: hypothetical protein ACYS3S_26195 [Planctomycetota bacterium]
MSRVTNRTTCLMMSVLLPAIFCTAAAGKIMLLLGIMAQAGLMRIVASRMLLTTHSPAMKSG